MHAPDHAGGNGESGMGIYHGEYGFRAFSHEKGVMTADADADPGAARFPPFD